MNIKTIILCYIIIVISIALQLIGLADVMKNHHWSTPQFRQRLRLLANFLIVVDISLVLFLIYALIVF